MFTDLGSALASGGIVGFSLGLVGGADRRSLYVGARKDGQALRVRVNGQFTFNNSYAMIDAAVNGYGSPMPPRTSWSSTSLPARWSRCWAIGHPCSAAISSIIRAAARTCPRSKSLPMHYATAGNDRD